MLNQLTARFPGICQIADDGNIFSADVAILNRLRNANQNPRDFVEAVYEEANLQAKDLMMAVSFPVLAPEAADSVGDHLERDLQLLLGTLQPARLRAVFGAKLLARNTPQWIDAVHEIAIASTSLGFYDQGTLELEKAIPGTNNNSDIYGLLNGNPFRIDATVIHENWPPVSPPDAPVIAYTRNTMDKAELDDLLAKNPKDVVTFAQLPTNPATHTSTPLSTKVWQALQSKRRQCEPGRVNVIAIGLPRPLIDDRGTEDAVLGVLHAVVDRNTDQTAWVRHGTGPFVPERRSADVATCVDPFRIMSGVWLTRWNAGYPLSKVLENPNAAAILSEQNTADLIAAGTRRAMWR